MKYLTALLFILVSYAMAATLNVLDYGAVADCTEITVNVTTNSNVIVTSSPLGAGAVGKVVQLFGAGYYATLLGPGEGGIFNGNYYNTPTNHMDLVANVMEVDGNNVTLDRNCGVTATGIRCTIGTQNKAAFDAAILAAGVDDTIYIPTGNYHLVEPNALNSNYVQTVYSQSGYTLTITGRGSLTFLGDGTNSTILTGTGAWQQKSYDDAYRGSLFRLNGNVTTTNGPLIFNGIQFNGNATRNHSTLYTSWPAVPTDGSGWDGTHHAFTDACTPNGHAYKSWTNCLFTRWHGETIAGIADGSGYIDVGNCWFVDGNSTVINFNYRHDFHDNLVDDYYQVAEDGQFLEGTGTSYIRNNFFTNIYGSVTVALVGAYVGVAAPAYNISSNNFYTTSGKYAIGTAGIRNVTINSNTFNSGMIVLGMAGNQSDYWNSDITITTNVFLSSPVAVMFVGNGGNRVETVTVANNSATGLIENFGQAVEGGGAWFTNVVFRYNTANKGLWCSYATGQWFKDESSNDFPFYSTSDNTGVTNALTYKRGMKHSIAAAHANSVWTLDDTLPVRVPLGASMVITNSGVATPVTVYLSRTNYPSSDSVSVTKGGDMQTLYWNGSAWRTTIPSVARSTTINLSNLKGR